MVLCKCPTWFLAQIAANQIVEVRLSTNKINFIDVYVVLPWHFGTQVFLNALTLEPIVIRITPV